MGRRKDYKPGGKRFPLTDGVSGGSRLERQARAQGASLPKHDFRAKARTQDGFENFTANLGMGQDNLLARGGYTPGSYITHSYAELDDMYRSSWIVGRMIDVVAEDMVSGGVEIQAQMDPGDKDELQKEMRRKGVPGRLSDAIKWGSLYGGALAVILIDGDALDTPLAIDSIMPGSFKGLHVLDRHQVTPLDEKITDLGPMLGYPAGYRVFNEAMQGEIIHHSRALRFTGIDLPDRQRRAEQFWGGSVVDRAYDRIIALDSATHGTANMLYRSFLRVIGVERLRDILSAGGPAEKALTKMFTMIRQMQSNEGLTVLDSKDTFTTHGWTFAGIYDALQAFAEQIAGATGIPLVRLLGQSPKGFSTGESDLRTYYDTISTKQDDDLLSPMDTLFAVCSRSLWGRPLPDGFSFSFRSLYKPTELEKSQIATADAQAVAGLRSMDVISKGQALSELRNSSKVTGRFSGITDEEIAAAEKEDEAPPLPEGMDPQGQSAGAGYGGQFQ